MEPDWLASEISRKLTLDLCMGPNCQGGYRKIAETINNAKIVSVASTKPQQSLSPQLQNDNNNVTLKKAKFKRDHYGETQLHKACRKGDVKKVEELLVKYDSDIVGIRDNNDWTAMHEACKHGRIDCVKKLLNHPGGGVSLSQKAGEEGYTPLFDAVRSGFNDITEVICRFLKENGQLDIALSSRSADGKSIFELSENVTMQETLENFRRKQRESLGDPIVLQVSHPKRFSLVVGSFIYRYGSAFRLNAVKKIMKGLANEKVQSIPLLELGFCPPYRRLESSKRLYDYPFDRDQSTAARDISIYWKKVSKPNYFLPLIRVICD